MAGSTNPRSEEYAQQFEAAQDRFIALIESLDHEQWRRVGKNYPQRMNDEDEGRRVGVIAHHVASSQASLLGRIERTVRGEAVPPIDIRGANARHAAEHADATRSEVLEQLRRNRQAVGDGLRAIPDEQLDLAMDSPVGPMSLAQRIERVLIGHTDMHRGSIEAAIS